MEGMNSLFVSVVPYCVRQFVMEGMHSLSVSATKEKVLLQQETQYQGSLEPWRYLPSM